MGILKIGNLKNSWVLIFMGIILRVYFIALVALLTRQLFIIYSINNTGLFVAAVKFQAELII